MQDTNSLFDAQEFHLYHPTAKGGIWYYGEILGKDWAQAIQNDPAVDKSKAPAITMTRFEGGRRQIKHIEANHGFYSFDVDGANEFAPLCKRLLFKIEQIVLVWISPSGNGVKAIGHFPEFAGILDPIGYRRAYARICQYLNSQVKPYRINFDPSQGVITQPTFFSSDPTALYK